MANRDCGRAWVQRYATRRDGVLLILSVNTDTRPSDDLPGIAATLHPLDVHGLWPHLTGVGLPELLLVRPGMGRR